MSEGIRRRRFIKGLTACAISARALRSLSAQSVPNSAGSRRPRLVVPPNSCDCHHHIYDRARFAPQPSEMPFIADARVEEYRQLQGRLGTARSVVVPPAPYVDDHRCTLDAIRRMAPNAVGVGVLRPDATDATLKTLAAAGIKGLRFSVNDARNKAVSVDMIEPLAHRIAPLGWHVQIQMTADQIVAAADLLRRLPTPIVFDHMGNIPPTASTAHAALPIMLDLVERRRAWVKLSATFSNTAGPPYADLTKVARVFVSAVPDRLVWGSNWPHPTEATKPDDADLIDLLEQWAPDESVRHRILVENPQELYGFM